MGRLRISTRVHAATMRVSSLPPKRRYIYWSFWVAGVAMFAVPLVFFTHVPYVWLAMIAGEFVWIAGWFLGLIWKNQREFIVRTGTQALDDKYETLCQDYWSSE